MFKNFKLIRIVCLVLAAMVALSSCSKPEKTIIGKWKITKGSYSIMGEKYPDECSEGETWLFEDGGKCILFTGIGCMNYEGKYTVKKNILTIDVESEYIDDYTISLSGELDIDEINKEEMSVSGTVKRKDSDENISYDMKISYELEKK